MVKAKVEMLNFKSATLQDIPGNPDYLFSASFEFIQTRKIAISDCIYLTDSIEYTLSLDNFIFDDFPDKGFVLIPYKDALGQLPEENILNNPILTSLSFKPEKTGYYRIMPYAPNSFDASFGGALSYTYELQIVASELESDEDTISKVHVKQANGQWKDYHFKASADLDVFEKLYSIGEDFIEELNFYPGLYPGGLESNGAEYWFYSDVFYLPKEALNFPISGRIGLPNPSDLYACGLGWIKYTDSKGKQIQTESQISAPWNPNLIFLEEGYYRIVGFVWDSPSWYKISQGSYSFENLKADKTYKGINPKFIEAINSVEITNIADNAVKENNLNNKAIQKRHLSKEVVDFIEDTSKSITSSSINENFINKRESNSGNLLPYFPEIYFGYSSIVSSKAEENLIMVDGAPFIANGAVPQYVDRDNYLTITHIGSRTIREHFENYPCTEFGFKAKNGSQGQYIYLKNAILYKRVQHEIEGQPISSYGIKTVGNYENSQGCFFLPNVPKSDSITDYYITIPKNNNQKESLCFTGVFYRIEKNNEALKFALGVPDVMFELEIPDQGGIYG